jgi:hypothetical protein
MDTPQCKKDKGFNMKKVLFLVVLSLLPMIMTGCVKKCEVEPIVAQNHKLIVPPNFGQMPK